MPNYLKTILIIIGAILNTIVYFIVPYLLLFFVLQFFISPNLILNIYKYTFLTLILIILTTFLYGFIKGLYTAFKQR